MQCNLSLGVETLLYQTVRLRSKKAAHPVSCLHFAPEGGGLGRPDALCSLLAGPEGSSCLYSSQGVNKSPTDDSCLYQDNAFQLIRR